MIFSVNKAIGAAVYRTREALNGNKAFLKALESYEYCHNSLYDGEFHLWHYPGTYAEIARCIIDQTNSRYKFPAILNFLPVREITRRVGGDTIVSVSVNLAIVASTLSDWLTEQREPQTFDLVLRPIYDEFLRQIGMTRYFETGYGDIPHTKYEVFTTGGNQGALVKTWGEHVDAIEIHDLELILNPKLCEEDYAQMVEDNYLLTTFNN
jgi:hypothetical protein